MRDLAAAAGPQSLAQQGNAGSLPGDGRKSSCGRNAVVDSTSARPGACALTFDVEEYFQVWSLSERVPRRDWAHWPSRVEASTEALLGMLAECGATATFFTLGWVADRCPRLIRRIVACGHELASHGYSHELAYTQTRSEFFSDIKRSKMILEDEGGCRVLGYRAPSFSLGSRTPWAHAALAEAGYVYSSSSHPVKNDHYGDSTELDIIDRDGVLEIPVAVARILGQNLPCAGGGYFRLLPRWWTYFGLKFAMLASSGPHVFYLHPWEVDPEQPRPARLKAMTRMRHYTRLEHCAGRLDALLRSFAWQRLDGLLGLQGYDRVPRY